MRDDAKAVVLNLVNPVGSGWRRFRGARQARLEGADSAARTRAEKGHGVPLEPSWLGVECLETEWGSGSRPA
jgi:hypothetical protein